MASINGFTVVPYGDSHLKTYAVPGSDVRLSVRAEVAPLLIGFAADFHRLVEPLIAGQCWGHAPRRISGSTSWSFHAPGIAIDLNAKRHPMGVGATFTTRQIMAVRQLQDKYSYGGRTLIRWGQDYRSRVDGMHFELIQSRTNCLAAVRLLQTPKNWTEKLMTNLPTLRLGAEGTDVRTWQGLLCARGFIVKIDGEFGPDTEDKTKRLQRALGADHGVDGVVGPETWHMGLTNRDVV